MAASYYRSLSLLILCRYFCFRGGCFCTAIVDGEAGGFLLRFTLRLNFSPMPWLAVMPENTFLMADRMPNEGVMDTGQLMLERKKEKSDKESHT